MITGKITAKKNSMHNHKRWFAKHRNTTYVNEKSSNITDYICPSDIILEFKSFIAYDAICFD